MQEIQSLDRIISEEIQSLERMITSDITIQNVTIQNVGMQIFAHAKYGGTFLITLMYRFLFVDPLLTIYRHGPSIAGYGFWEGMEAIDICAMLTPGVESKWWATQPEKCLAMIDAKANSFVVGVHFTLYVCTLLLIFFTIFLRLCIIRPMTRTLGVFAQDSHHNNSNNNSYNNRNNNGNYNSNNNDNNNNHGHNCNSNNNHKSNNMKGDQNMQQDLLKDTLNDSLEGNLLNNSLENSKGNLLSNSLNNSLNENILHSVITDNVLFVNADDKNNQKKKTTQKTRFALKPIVATCLDTTVNVSKTMENVATIFPNDLLISPRLTRSSKRKTQEQPEMNETIAMQKSAKKIK